MKRYWAAVCAIGYLLAMAIVFRTWIASGFDLGFGDRADGIIEISLLEHWRNVLTGAEAWNAPLYFWPYPDTLGYNDGYLLSGLDYAFWRTIADPFRADMLNVVVFKTVGFWAALWLARRTLGLDRPVALMIALLFTIACGTMRQAAHAQLQTVALLPVAALLATAIVRDAVAGRSLRARLAAAALAVLMGAWLMTAYYMAWFTFFFAGAFAVAWMLTSGAWRPHRLIHLARRHGATAAVFAVVLALSCAPFLAVYLPKAAESGGHPFAEVRNYLTWAYGIANVGEDHYLWGWMLQPLHARLTQVGGPALAEARLGGENVSGFPLLILAAIVASIVALVRRGNPPATRALAWAVAVTWLATIQAGPESPWSLVYRFVPGASGLRVVVRYQLFLVLPALILVGLAQRHRLERLVEKMPIAALAIGVVLIAEQIAPMTSAALSRSGQADLLAVGPPPAGCRRFYVVQARPRDTAFHTPTDDRLYPHNVDAMFLAARWHLPTLNGYATFMPHDWAFADPLAPDYDARVLGYVRAHGLVGVCRLDARSPSPWRRVD